jgi:hypothetical protein
MDPANSIVMGALAAAAILFPAVLVGMWVYTRDRRET